MKIKLLAFALCLVFAGHVTAAGPSFESKYAVALSHLKVWRLGVVTLNSLFLEVWQASVGTATEREAVERTLASLKKEDVWLRADEMEKSAMDLLRALQPPPAEYAPAVEKLLRYYSRVGDLRKMLERPAASFEEHFTRFREIREETERLERELAVSMPAKK